MGVVYVFIVLISVGGLYLSLDCMVKGRREDEGEGRRGERGGRENKGRRKIV